MSVTKKLAVIFAVLALALAAAAVCMMHGSKISTEAEENGDLKIEILDDGSPYLKNGYIERYGVPTEMFEYNHNGGEEAGAPIANAFDRNFNSIWRSALQYKAADKENTTNYVEAEFSSPVLLDRIIYQADCSWYDRGYPNKIRISYVKEGESGYTALQELASSPTGKIVLITLNQSQTVSKIKIEWTEVNPRHRTCAAASEIIFMQPHSADVEAVQNMFTDYAQLQLSPDIKTVQDVENLRKKVEGYAAYQTEISALLNRAEQVLAKTAVYDSRREISTDPDAENVLNRFGDVAGYARSDLKMPWFGTNRQVTGISAGPKDVLTIYVTGDENDPLPSLVVTQFWGSWSSWRSGEYKLRLGKNVIRPANYVQAGFSTNKGEPIPAGGPIYLTNPYTPDKQSRNVKVYIEGGTLIPVFRKGGDEGLYYNRLKEYANYVESDKSAAQSENRVENAVDVTEIVSRNIILTVQASLADAVYNTQGYSVEEACRGWDEYVGELLESDGVVIDENNNKYNGRYDPRAKYLNCNIRLMQPFGAAYAFTEHVGIQVDWERGALIGSGFGWGYTHELGHMMDIGERLVSECSNNMLSKYNETAIEKVAERGDFAKTTAALAPDIRSESSYWNTNRGNFIIWWLIESFEIGYWPRLENLYRYESVPETYGKMNATEKQVYLSSISVGYDLSYYFERWGYNLSSSDYIFKADSASTAFKSLMADAKKDGRIKDEGYQPKIWYLDAAEYLLRKEGAEKTQLYTKEDVPVLQSVTKCAEGYNLFIDMEKCTSPAHLGFEIWEGTGENKHVVGFSYARAYTDATKYENGYIPVYSVVAYDRALQTSAESNQKRIEAQAEVCKIGSTTYGSIYEALLQAKNGDEIVILKDCHSAALKIDKDITVSTDGSSRTIYKACAEPLFTVTAEGKLTLKGSRTAQLVLDGNSFDQLSPLVSAAGSLSAEYCVFQNNTVKQQRQGLGGAIYAAGTSNAIIDISNCTFKNNSAWRGGAVYVRSGAKNNYSTCMFTGNSAVDGGAVYCGNSRATFQNCTFSGNAASGNGGAVAVCEGSVGRLENCTLSSNQAANGGGIYADSATTLVGGQINLNFASAEGGAIYYSTTVAARRFTAESVKISSNNCGAAAVYLSGTATLNGIDIQSGDCVYALCCGGGSTQISGGKLSGSVFVGANSAVTAHGELFTPYENEKIKLFTDMQIDDADGANPVFVLITSDFDIDATAANGFECGLGDVVVGNGNRSLCITLQTITVSFTADGKTTEKRYLPGQQFALDNNSGTPQTYVTSWQRDGKEYNVGDIITVDEPMTFLGVTANKVAVTYHTDKTDAFNDETLYYIPGESYALKSYNIERYILNGWDNGGTTYMPYITAVATQNITYTANLTAKLKVDYYISDTNGENRILITTRYYAFGEKLQFADWSSYKGPALKEDYIPDMHVIESYKIHQSGEMIDVYNYSVTSDLELDAYVTNMPSYVIYGILYSDGGTSDPTDFITDEVKYGSEYVVSLDVIPYGYHIISLKFDSHDYSAEDLDGFVINNATEPYYSIEIVLERNLYNVSYQYNGEEFKTEQTKYGTEIVLEIPENLPQNYHFTSYQIGKTELVYDEDEGIYAMRDVDINMNLGDKITVTEDTVINILVYIEGREQLPQDTPDTPTPGNPGNTDNPDTPGTSGDAGETQNPSNGGSSVSCGGCGSMDIGGGLTLGGGTAATIILLIAVCHVLRKKSRS